MILQKEAGYFFADLEDSVTLAAEGWLAEGYELLDLGLACAEIEPDSCEKQDLVGRYRRALMSYGQMYGITEPPAEVDTWRSLSEPRRMRQIRGRTNDSVVGGQ